MLPIPLIRSISLQLASDVFQQSLACDSVEAIRRLVNDMLEANPLTALIR